MNTKHGNLVIGVALLVLCAFVGTASAEDTYSFSVSSTFGDRDIFNFTVTKEGAINAQATWTGAAANLTLILNGPGQVGYYAREDGPRPLSLSYTVTSADLSKGTDWRISIVNFGGGAASGTVTITYPTGPFPTPVPHTPTPWPSVTPTLAPHTPSIPTTPVSPPPRLVPGFNTLAFILAVLSGYLILKKWHK